jgi:hypothetical protein
MSKLTQLLSVTTVAFGAVISSANAEGLPDPGVEFDKGHVAIVITDPQVDFPSPDGVTWHLVGNVRRQHPWDRFSSGLKECFCSS